MALPGGDPELTIYGFKLSVIFGGIGGGIASSLLQEGGIFRGGIYAVTGTLFSIFVTGWALEFGSKFFMITRDAERGLAFIFGLSGYLLAKGVFSAVDRIRARAPKIIDAQIDKRIGK